MQAMGYIFGILLAVFCLGHFAEWFFSIFNDVCLSGPKSGAGKMLGCFVFSLFGLVVWVAAIPSYLMDIAFKNMFAEPTSFSNSTLPTLSIFLIAMGWIYRQRLLDLLTTSASYTVKPDTDHNFSTSSIENSPQADFMQEEAERQSNRVDLERAVREMEEAKARIDAFKNK